MARYVALFNQRDWDGLRALLADDVKLHQSLHPLRVGRRPGRRWFEHGRDIEFGLSVTQVRRAPHRRKGLEGVGRSHVADVERQSALNQICAKSFCSIGAEASGLDVSAAFGDELTAAMATAAAPILVVILIVTSR